MQTFIVQNKLFPFLSTELTNCNKGCKRWAKSKKEKTSTHFFPTDPQEQKIDVQGNLQQHHRKKSLRVLFKTTLVFHFLPFAIFSVTTSSSSPPPPPQNILTHSHHLHLSQSTFVSLSLFTVFADESWKLWLCTRKYTQYRSTQEETWLHRHTCSLLFSTKGKGKWRNEESKVCVSAAKFLKLSPLVH